MQFHVLLLTLFLCSVYTKEQFHFVHVPKSGGSTVTTYLRQYANCHPPGFCCTAPGLPVGICNETRLCDAIIGCTRHEPHINLLQDPKYHSVLSLRDPLQRAISGFLYPYHHGSHKLFRTFIQDKRYQNVAVKMLNGISPYDAVTISAEHTETALKRLKQFEFIIIAEAMNESILDMFNKLPGHKVPHTLPNARVNNEASSRHVDPGDVQLFNQLNRPDIELYQHAISIFCETEQLPLICERVHGSSLINIEAKLTNIKSILQLRQKSHSIPVPDPLPWVPPATWNHESSCRDAHFYHFPGHYKPKRDAAVTAYFKDTKPFPALSSEVIIAFPWATKKPSESLAERIYKFHDYPYINYLEGETVFTRWWSKVGPLMDLLRTSRLKRYKYIVVHDASDVLLMNAPTDIVERFEAYDCDILMGTTDADWPPDSELHAFERDVAPWSRHHAHITAGMFMARISTLLTYMEDLERESKSFKGSFNDQRHWRRLHGRAYPRVKADSLCKIFVRTDEFIDSV